MLPRPYLEPLNPISTLDKIHTFLETNLFLIRKFPPSIIDKSLVEMENESPTNLNPQISNLPQSTQKRKKERKRKPKEMKMIHEATPWRQLVRLTCIRALSVPVTRREGEADGLVGY